MNFLQINMLISPKKQHPITFKILQIVTLQNHILFNPFTLSSRKNRDLNNQRSQIQHQQHQYRTK